MRIILALTFVTISVCCIASDQIRERIGIPVPFDWEDYKQIREQLLNDFYATHEDARGYYCSLYEVRQLFDTGYPRAFWETLSEEKELSEVYLALEVGSCPELYYDVYTVFRSSEEYYFARWSSLYRTDSGAVVDWQDGYPVQISNQKVDSAQVFAFLEYCDSAYNLLDVKSFDAERMSDPVFYAMILVSYRNANNMLLIQQVRSRDFKTLDEFRLFFDRLTRDDL